MNVEEIDLDIFLGSWRDSMGNTVQVDWSKPGNRGGQLDVVLSRRGGRGDGIRLNVKHHGGRRFSCGHYNLDADETHRRRIVWVDGRNSSKSSIWERVGDEPPPSKPPSNLAQSSLGSEVVGRSNDKDDVRDDLFKPRAAGGPNWYVRFTGRAPPRPDEVDGREDAVPREPDRPSSVWSGSATPGAWTPPSATGSTELAPIPAADVPGAAGIDTAVEESRRWRVAIEDLYKQFNPDKLKDLDQILEKYRGGEEQLYRALCEKYMPAWTPGGLPPGQPPPVHWPAWQAHPHAYPPGHAPAHWHHPPPAPAWWPPPPQYMHRPPATHRPREAEPAGDRRSMSPPPGAWTPGEPKAPLPLTAGPSAPRHESFDHWRAPPREEDTTSEPAQKRPKTDKED